MLYLRREDYYRLIAEAELNQITRNDDSMRIDAEAAAYEEISGHLKKRYDLSFEFKDTVQYVHTDTYKAGQLVFLDAVAYSASATYALNAMMLYNGNVYFCKTAILVGEAFDAAKWTLIGPQYKTFYIPLPYPRFNINNDYVLADLVWWKDKNYKALSGTGAPSHNSILQLDSNAVIPTGNYFPDDASRGQYQWGTGTLYQFSLLNPNYSLADFTAWSAGSYLAGDRRKHNDIVWQAVDNTSAEPGTDITKWMPITWTAGDNRNRKLVQVMIDISLYEIHSTIAPRNIPQLRIKRRDEAIIYLEKIAEGKVDVTLDEIQPNQGQAYSGGSLPKRKNHW